MTAGGKRIGAGRKPLNVPTQVMSIRINTEFHDNLKKLNLMIKDALNTPKGVARNLKFERCKNFAVTRIN